VALLRSRRTRAVDEREAAGDLSGAIGALTEVNRSHRDPAHERRLIELRHRAGEELVAAPASNPQTVAKAAQPPPTNADGLPEIGPAQLSAPLLRAAILGNGCLLVRGLAPREDALRVAQGIDRAFAARESGTGADDGLYEEFEPGPPYGGFVERGFTAETGGMWTVDSPRLAFEVLDLFERIGLREVLSEYLGERPAISAQKGTLRKVDRARVGWHQDGRFLGEVRTMNVWLSLSRCGDIAPGLDLVPQRIEEIVPSGTEGADFDWSVARSVAERYAGEGGIARPIFEPGDALLFDELCLHGTAAEEEMPNPRYAVETWFFGPSAFPSEYVPLLF
jgi:hypothetical protein